MKFLVKYVLLFIVSSTCAMFSEMGPFQAAKSPTSFAVPADVKNAIEFLRECRTKILPNMTRQTILNNAGVLFSGINQYMVSLLKMVNGANYMQNHANLFMRHINTVREQTESSKFLDNVPYLVHIARLLSLIKIDNTPAGITGEHNPTMAQFAEAVRAMVDALCFFDPKQRPLVQAAEDEPLNFVMDPPHRRNQFPHNAQDAAPAL